jgi:hypothetical protein
MGRCGAVPKCRKRPRKAGIMLSDESDSENPGNPACRRSRTSGAPAPVDGEGDGTEEAGITCPVAAIEARHSDLAGKKAEEEAPKPRSKVPPSSTACARISSAFASLSK